MHHDIRPVLGRPHQHRGCDRVVDDQRHAVTVRHAGERLEIADVACRIAHGFAKHGPGIVIDQRLDVGGRIRFRELHFDAEARQEVCEQGVGRAIELRHRDDIAAHLRHVERRVVKRRLARATLSAPTPPSSSATRCSRMEVVGFAMRV